MESDLAVTVAIGSVALGLIALLFWWIGRADAAETVAWAKKLGIWTPATRESERSWSSGHRCAAPFLNRYARILGISALLAFLLTFLSDIASAVVYCIGLVLLFLGIVVVRKKAHQAVSSATSA